MKKMMTLLIILIITVLGMASAEGIVTDQEMYLLYKSEEQIDENGNKYVDLVFCYVDESGINGKLSTFNRPEPFNSSKAGDIVEADVVFGRSACEADAFYDEKLGYWVVRLTITDATALRNISKFEVQISASRIIESDQGVQRFKYKADNLQLTQIYQSSGISSGEVLYAIRNSDGIMEQPESYTVSAEAMKAALGENIQFNYQGYSVGFHNNQMQTELNLFAVKKMITPVSKHYNTDGILTTILFWDTQELSTPATISVEMDEFSDYREEYAYVYRYDNGRLELYTDQAVYSPNMDQVSFETDKLGSFVISSKPLEELPIIDMGSQDEETYETGEEKLIAKALEAMQRAFSVYDAHE